MHTCTEQNENMIQYYNCMFSWLNHIGKKIQRFLHILMNLPPDYALTPHLSFTVYLVNAVACSSRTRRQINLCERKMVQSKSIILKIGYTPNPSLSYNRIGQCLVTYFMPQWSVDNKSVCLRVCLYVCEKESERDSLINFSGPVYY